MNPDLDARPVRLNARRLAVPGVIGMRDPSGVSFSRVPHVLIGPDAGFPEFQPLDEWKNDVVLVDARALASGLRAAAGIRLPEEEIAECEALERELAEYGHLHAPVLSGEALSALRLAGRARLRAIDDMACHSGALSGESSGSRGQSR